MGTLERNADPLYEFARTIVLHARRASISLVQRNLRVGYSHASRLLDAMEGDILSSMDENGVRTILFDSTTESSPKTGD
jgi:S-DNA-T family DNA segregation ATPase FtsK/SpoIIIE